MVKVGKKLTLKQRLFCQFYIETLGNGTEAAVRAGYGVKRRNGQPDRILAKSIASENLAKPFIRKYIGSLLDKHGFTDNAVKLEHLKLIIQDNDLTNKRGAIDIYYKLKGKYPNPRLGIEHELSERMEKGLDRLASRLP